MTEGNVIYIIAADESPLVKIGTTDNLKRRLREIQNMCPVRLRVVWSTPGGLRTERALHRYFRAYRKHGEWFELADPVATVQAALVDPTLFLKPVRKVVVDARTPATVTRQGLACTTTPLNQHVRVTGEAARVHAELSSRIRSGEFPIGSQLPRPATLAKQYEVPVITAVSAVKHLQALGIVTWSKFQAPVIRKKIA